MHFYSTTLSSGHIPSVPTDHDLARRVTHKQTGALRELYRRYSHLVYASALRILKSREEAEDMTQEIFLFFWYGSGYRAERGSLKNFLVMKTRSRSIDRLRSRHARHRANQRLHSAANSRNSPNPIEHIVRDQAIQTVRVAFRSLSLGEREVLEGIYYRGLTQAEIARRLDIPLGTVKSRSRRGLRNLRCALIQHQIELPD